MLKGIHLLLTYMCNLECDHCFVYSGPNARGTFTLRQVRKVLDQAADVGTIEWIYFEGGEPFLFYPLMLQGITIARSMGFETGVVTNGYYATCEEDADLWLRPLRESGLSSLSLSDDSFHYEEDSPAKRAVLAANGLGIPVSSICIEKPTVEADVDKSQIKGAPVVGGGAMFRGRAVEKLVEGLPRRSWQELIECPYEDLREPGRIHIDAYGNAHLCQGLSVGNIWNSPLSSLFRDYDVDRHPICGPLARGGPALLATEYDVPHEEKYVDACHFCYLLRLTLMQRFPQYLAPKQVYGLE
jgi:MoaA/NifB/PqqE/SkfB family radical SAM enzyme